MNGHGGRSRSDALVMFGLTGDLGETKLFPALAELAETGRIEGPVIGVGRTEHSDADIQQMFRDAVGPEHRQALDRFALRYLQGDSAERSTYDALADLISNAEHPVIYLALPPNLFGSAARHVRQSRLPDTTRLVFEKPFGHGLSSARDLFAQVGRHLPVEQVFMVDHFLAKSSIDSLLSFRHANPMIDAAMRAGSVRRVEFTMAEQFDVDGRGSFYDGVGAVKDVLQNHILQTVAVLMMEPPETSSAGDYDAARANLLGAIRPIDPESVLFGQYSGYLDTVGVSDESTTETYVACTLQVECPRWSGVEVVLRTGKALRDTYTEAVLVFDDGADGRPANRLRFELKPNQRVTLELAVPDGQIDTGYGFRAERFAAATVEDAGPLSDYATMLDGAMAGDHYHFARIDDTLAAWGIVEPIIGIERRPVPYERGSMGPSDAGWLPLSGHWTEWPPTPSSPPQAST